MSVVQFSDTARITLSLATLQKASTFVLKIIGGGTRFQPALDSAKGLFKSGNSEMICATPLLVFMSDGQNGDGDMEPYMRMLCNEICNLQCHTVYFGTGGSTRLQQMANTVPNGKYHLSVDGMELQRTFQAIAADITAL